MGYYSEVGLALTGNGVKEMQTRLADANFDARSREEVKNLLDYADQHYIDPDSQAEIWHWRDIKWYTNDPQYFPEIDFVQRLLEGLDEEIYRVIRIGEDYDDTEAYGCFTENPFDLELARGISIRPAWEPA